MKRLLLLFLLCVPAFAQYGASADRVYNELAATLDPTDTTITLTDGTAFPDDDYFVVVCPEGECQIGATAANGETIGICGKASTHVLDICSTGREVQADGTGTSTGDGGNPSHAIGEAVVLTIVAGQWNMLADALVTLDAATSGTNTGDDDVPDAGDFGAATDLDANGALDAGTVSANELDEAGVEAGLEAVMDLQDLQGAVTDGQVPNTITVDLATVATTANAGDSATSFFPSGTIEKARLPCVVDLFSPLLSENGGGTYTQASGIDRGASTTVGGWAITLDDNEGFEWYTSLPRCWTNESLTFEIQVGWSGFSTTGSSNMEIETACIDDGDTSVSYNAAQNITNISCSSCTSSERYSVSSLTTTGCAGGSQMKIRLTFDLNGRTGDTAEAISGIWLYN